MAKSPTSGWDPVLLISQIVSMQSLHYLTLSLFIPPLLSLFAEPEALNYEGGAASVGMVMDWREMAGRPTVRGIQGENPWSAFAGVWSGGKKVGYSWGNSTDDHSGAWNGRADPMRGWIIAFCWIVACTADIYYMYTLVRRPRLILDFALSLVFVHFILTTYYSASIPSSLFFWVVMAAGSALTVIVTEQLCVKREMREGLGIPGQGLLDPDPEADADEREEDMEMGNLSRRD